MTQVCKAAYNYDATADNELSVLEDQLVLVRDTSDADWWLVSPLSDLESQGLVPASYLEPQSPLDRIETAYEYSANTSDELSFPEGVILDVYDTSDPEWWFAGYNGMLGLVPSNYLQESSNDVGVQKMPMESPPIANTTIQVINQVITPSAHLAPDDIKYFALTELDKKKKKAWRKGAFGISSDYKILYVNPLDKNVFYEWDLKDVKKYSEKKGKKITLEVGNETYTFEGDKQDIAGVVARLDEVSLRSKISGPIMTNPLPVVGMNVDGGSKRQSMIESRPVSTKMRVAATALYDYDAQTDDELTIRENDELEVIEKSEPGWALVRNIKTGREGSVPESYIEEKTGLNAIPEPPKILATTPQSDLPELHSLRTWTDRSGSFKVEAKYLGIENGKVRLHKSNGTKITVPLEKLDKIDIEHLKSMPENRFYNFPGEVAGPPLVQKPVILPNRPPPTLPERPPSPPTALRPAPKPPAETEEPPPLLRRPPSIPNAPLPPPDIMPPPPPLLPRAPLPVDNRPPPPLLPRAPPPVDSRPPPPPVGPPPTASLTSSQPNRPTIVDSVASKIPPVSEKFQTTERRAQSVEKAAEIVIYNGFNWKEWLLKAGFPEDDAIKYSKEFVREKMDQTSIPHLEREILKAIGMTEGEIIRVRRVVTQVQRPAPVVPNPSDLRSVEKQLTSYADSIKPANPSRSSSRPTSGSFAPLPLGSMKEAAQKLEQLKEDEELAKKLQEQEVQKAFGKPKPSNDAPPSSSTSAPKSGLPDSVLDSLRQEAEDVMLAAAIRASTKNLTSEAPPPPKPSASTKPVGKPVVNNEDPWSILEQTTTNSPKVSISAAPVSKPRPIAPTNTTASAQNSNAHNPFGAMATPAVRPIQPQTIQQTLPPTMARPMQPPMTNIVNRPPMMQAPLIPTPQTNPHNVFIPVAARPAQPIPQQMMQPMAQPMINPIVPLQNNFQNMNLQSVPIQHSMNQAMMMNPQANDKYAALRGPEPMTMQSVQGMRPMNMHAQLMGTANLQQAALMNQSVMQPPMNQPMMQPPMNQPIMRPSMNQSVMQPSMNQSVIQPSMNQPMMQSSMGTYNQPIGMQQQGMMNPVMMQTNMGQQPIMQQGVMQQPGLQQPTNPGYPQQPNMYQGMYGNRM